MPAKQIPLIGEEGPFQVFDQSGQTAAYEYYLNGYFEKNVTTTESRQFAYVKRPGLQFQVTGTPFTNNHKIQGVIGSVDRSKILAYSNSGAANTVWYWDGTTLTNKGVAPAAAGNWSFTGPVVFTLLDGISYGANVNYAVTDFTKGATVDATGNWTEITDADFTGLTKVTNFVGLDGYLFIGTSNNRIYNSDLNTSSSWQALSFLTAADSPGALLWLARIRNYLIVFKDRSIEFFEDVGNPAPGSPLEARKQFNRTIGCINRSSIQEVSDGIIFAGASGSQSPKMYKISKTNLQITEISNRYVARSLINGFNTSYSCDSVAGGAPTQLNGGQSQVFQIGAKEFYTITLEDAALSGKRLTHAFDNDLQIWTIWTTAFGGSGTNDTHGFVGSQAVTHNITTAACAVFVDNMNSGASSPPLLRAMSPDIGANQDGSSPVSNFIFSWVSDNIDFGNRKRKFLDRFEVHYDMKSSATPNPTAPTFTMTLQYRDHDYISATGYMVSRSLFLDLGSGCRCIATRLGQFRRRNFAISFLGDAQLRIWAIEIDYNQGETDQDG